MQSNVLNKLFELPNILKTEKKKLKSVLIWQKYFFKLKSLNWPFRKLKKHKRVLKILKMLGPHH
jgi:hypothetical protein